MVGSGVLLLMVTLASMATISYLRGYGHYTKEGAKLRVAAKTLESLCLELRSARAFKVVPKSVRQTPLEFEDTKRRQCSLQFRGDELWIQREPDPVRIGQAADVNLSVREGLLEIRMPVKRRTSPPRACSTVTRWPSDWFRSWFWSSRAKS